MTHQFALLVALVAFLCVSFIAADENFSVSAKLSGTDTPLDEVAKPSNLALAFLHYDPLVHGTQFTFKPTTTGHDLKFDPEMLKCQEDTYQSTIVVDAKENKISLTFLNKVPDLLTCTIAITNPSTPTIDSSLTLGPVEQIISLPGFYQYFPTTFQFVPVAPKLQELTYYTFGLHEALQAKGGDEVYFSWSLGFVVELELTGTCAGNRDEIHTYEYTPHSHTMLIKLQAGYVFQAGDSITCALTNPETAPEEASFAKVSTIDTLTRSYPLKLPSFEPAPFEPVIEAITVVPSQTKVGVATKLTIDVEISDQYLTDQHDRLFFKTWARFNAQGECTYGPENQFSITVDNETDGFSIQVQDNWSSVFYDNKIKLVCVGFTPAEVHAETKDNTVKIQTDDPYTSPAVAFTLPAFTNDQPDPQTWKVAFTTSITVPQTSAVNTWTIQSSQDIATPIQVQFNATKASFISAANCDKTITFEDLQRGIGKFTIPANSLKKNKDFVFTCQVQNQPYQVVASEVVYEIREADKLLWQGPVAVPAYAWPTQDTVAIKTTIEADLKFFAEFESVTKIFVDIFKLKAGDVWPMSIAPKTASDEISGRVGHRGGRRHHQRTRRGGENGSRHRLQQMAQTDVASYFESTDAYTTLDNVHTQTDEFKLYTVVFAFSATLPADIDAKMESIKKKVLKSTTAKKFDFEPAASLPYPHHCSDGKLNPIAEADVDCGVGDLDSTSGIACQPCALEKRCIMASQCVSQICEHGRCSSNSAHLFTAGVIMMALVMMFAQIF